MILRRVNPPAYLLMTLVATGCIALVAPRPRVVSSPWTFLGLVPLVLGIFLNLSADNALKRARTTVKPMEASRALVTSGAYRVSRHPMYLGFVLMSLGSALLLGALWALLLPLPLAIFLEFVFVRFEEKKLEKAFGEEWMRYRSHVRRWL